MSKKLLILQRMTALLTDTPLVHVHEGKEYSYDLKDKVFRGRKFNSEVPDYALSIIEGQRPAFGDGVGYNDVVRREDWTLNIQGAPVDDKDNPSDNAYLMAAAVEERLTRVIQTAANDATGMGGGAKYPDAYMFGGLITNMTIAGSVVLPAQENLSRYTFFYIPLILSVVKDARS